MTSEIRANTLKNRVGLGTVSFTNTGPVVSGIVTIANSTAEGVRLEDNAGVGGSLKITTPTGYVSIGAGNATFAHLQTDRGIFYFNKRISVDEGIISSYDEDLVLQSPMNTNRMTINKTTGLVSIVNDLDVDGHTNLDNVSIAGVTTFSNNVKFDGATAGRDVTFIRSSNTLEFATNAILELGNGGSGDCRLFNNGTDTRIINGDGTLKFESDTYEFKDKDNTTSYLNITSAGQVQINRDGGGGALTLGASQDFKFYHDAGGPTIFSDGGNQGLKLQIKELNLTEYSGTTTRLKINTNGKVIIGNNGTTFGNAAVQAFIQHGNTAGESGFSSVDTTSVAAGVGGEIAFHGKYNTGAQDWAYFGHIRGTKENATNGDTACALKFFTRPNATAPIERLRITSGGDMLLGAHGSRIFDDSSGTNVVVDIYGGTTAGKRGILALGGRTGSDDADIGTIQFVNENNSVATAANHNQSKLVSSIHVKSETSDGNAGSDSGGHLIFSTKPETGQLTERLRIKSDGDIEATGNLSTNNLSGRNIVINGDMRIAQRATSASMSSSGNDYPVCDRWQYNRNGPSSTIAQVAEAPAGRGFKYSLKWTNTSPVGSIAVGNVVKFSYAIERQDIQRLGYGSANGKKATISFWAKGSLSGKIGVSCTRDSRIFSANEDIVANTWKFVEITIPADTSTGFSGTDNSTGFYFGIVWGAGSNSTSGATNSWINFHNAYSAGFTAGQQGAYLTTNGSTFQITGVQLEIGSKSTPFEHKLLSDELARCYRYYNKVFDVEGQGGEKPASLAVYENNSTICTTFNFPKMRVVPTLDITNGTNKFMVRSNNVSDHFNTLTMRYGTTTTAELFQGTNVSGTSGYSGFLRGADTDVYIAFDAEL